MLCPIYRSVEGSGMKKKSNPMIVVVIVVTLIAVIVVAAYASLSRGTSPALPSTSTSPSTSASAIPSSLNESATLTIDPTSLQLPASQVGQTVSVNITVSNIQNLWAWALDDLKFNANVLNLTQVTEGPFLKNGGQTLFIWTSTDTAMIQKGDIPEISDTLLANTGINGTGTIATLTFQILSSGTSQIAFTQTTLLSPSEIGSTGTNVPINGTTTSNGQIIVGS